MKRCDWTFLIARDFRFKFVVAQDLIKPLYTVSPDPLFRVGRRETSAWHESRYESTEEATL